MTLLLSLAVLVMAILKWAVGTGGSEATVIADAKALIPAADMPWWAKLPLVTNYLWDKATTLAKDAATAIASKLPHTWAQKAEAVIGAAESGITAALSSNATDLEAYATTEAKAILAQIPGKWVNTPLTDQILGYLITYGILWMKVHPWFVADATDVEQVLEVVSPPASAQPTATTTATPTTPDAAEGPPNTPAEPDGGTAVNVPAAAATSL